MVGQTSPDLGKLITVAEAAARLEVSEKTIRRWIRLGRIDRHRLIGDRFTYVDAEQIAELRRQLDQRDLCEEPVEPPPDSGGWERRR